MGNDNDKQDEGGQVSSVQSLGDPDAPISDSQGVAGNPEAPDDIKEAGPNSNPHRDEETH